MAAAMGREPSGAEDDLLIVSTRSGPVAVSAGEVLGKRRVAVKALGPILGGSRSITGAALLGGGEVLVVVDPNYSGNTAADSIPPTPIPRGFWLLMTPQGFASSYRPAWAGRGFEVEVAEERGEAAAKLSSAKFDCLVVDYAMPRSNGVELVRALRAAGVTIPMVMVSGVANAEQQQAAWDAGVNAYLEKNDLRLGSLASTVRALLEGHNSPSPS